MVDAAFVTAAIGVGASAASLVYLAGAIVQLRRWARRAVPAAAVRPPVTILKPLCGSEPELYENLRSFCEQEYPTFQIVFGVQDPDDPALAAVRRLQHEWPHLDIRVVVDRRLIGSNRKVSNLANMLPQAKHDLVVIADSDIRVGPDYLRAIVGPLLDPGVGLVTCPYRARPDRSLWSRLGAMAVNESFLPSVLVARALGSEAFGFGSTLAVRRESLERVGGFGALAEHLADDYMLGELTRRRGLRTVLSPYLVETVTHEPDGTSLFHHELRWSRTIRALRPWGHAFSVITQALPVSLFGVALAGAAPWSLVLPLLALGGRLMLHYAAGASLGPGARGDVLLVPLRDLLSFAVWAASFLGRNVRWRRSDFAVASDGRMRANKESVQ